MSRPRKIAFLLPHFRAGGAERVVLNWIGALDRTRFQPMLFLTRIEGAFLDLLAADVRPIALGAARAIRLPRHIARALADHDIAVAYSATNAMNIALLAARAGQARRIVSEHTPPLAYLAEARLPWLRRAAMRHYYPRADAVAVPTARIGKELGSLIGKPLDLETLPNPVVSAVAEIGPRRTGNAIPQLVSAGRLVAAKGFDTLIDACARLAASDSPFRLTIHGEGALRESLEQRIVAAGLTGLVTLAGQTDGLERALAGADLFVLASRREGFGNVIIEAMAAGVPVLATRSGGPETFVRDRENGFLVAPDDPAALATTIARLIDDRVGRDSVRNAAAETARGFGIDASTRRFEALIDRLAPARSMAA